MERPGEWWGHEVDLTFRFFEPEAFIAAMTKAGFELEMQMERALNYPGEFESRRAYLQAHRD